MTTGRDPRIYPRLSDHSYLHLSLLRDAVQRHAPQLEGVVVDYGCGEKPYRPFFCRARRYIGVDFQVSGQDDLPLGEDGALPLEDRCADVVVSTQVLEHVPDVPLYLAECCRVLRPGGKLLLSTHGIWPYHTGPGSDDYFRWTGAGLRRILAQSGFEVQEVADVCGGWICLAQQCLAVRDPHAFRMSQPKWRRGVQRVVSWMVNGAALAAMKIAPDRVQAGDIIPICYLVLARKPAP